MGIETANLLRGVGTAASAYGAYSNAQGSKAAYNAQGQIAENNATISGWQADDALRRGAREASRSRMKTNQLKGTQRAALAANGVDLGVGSALNILTDTDQFGDIDASTITDNAAREAWALRNQASNFQGEASLMRSVAGMQSPMLAAGTSMLTSAGKVRRDWYSTTPGRKTVPTYENPEY